MATPTSAERRKAARERAAAALAEQAQAERQRRNEMIGEAIRNARIDRDLTQSQLGEMLKFPAPQTTVSRWEKGFVDLTASDLAYIEDALGIRRGTFAISLGFYAADFSDADVVDLLRSDPNLHGDLRNDMIRTYRSYVAISKRFFDAEDRKIRSRNSKP